ncbi:hypothetical protein REJC140_01180 [Pseudorhizobium endolithicum]|uniref:Uncharacterized protein n=1 Tax=Pseudorhizobium endolithicum TaxID=1191678 RepID=A0ABM8PQF8_9HYPH|nr:hypothetical protein [Pseudorhizobium endolithicum]CAD6431947.1 hypothetical protein REQ54_03647 [Rhizobium sp. Q54]CAD7042704.1 hypothetical protein REJC140_01180 [Pseudorhizobium endolithicum]
MTGKRLALRAFLCSVAAAAAWPAAAGDGWNSSARGSGYHHYYRAAPSIGYTSPVTRIPRVGTFSRSVWVVDPNRLKSRAPMLRPKATIIHVGDGLRLNGFKNPCSYEAGVCVIRANN